MTSSQHHAAAALLLQVGESESTSELAMQLLELAAWHGNESERVALASVELCAAIPTNTPGDDAIIS